MWGGGGGGGVKNHSFVSNEVLSSLNVLIELSKVPNGTNMK